jgi:hypothetical protein
MRADRVRRVERRRSIVRVRRVFEGLYGNR